MDSSIDECHQSIVDSGVQTLRNITDRATWGSTVASSRRMTRATVTLSPHGIGSQPGDRFGSNISWPSSFEPHSMERDEFDFLRRATTRSPFPAPPCHSDTISAQHAIHAHGDILKVFWAGERG